MFIASIPLPAMSSFRSDMFISSVFLFATTCSVASAFRQKPLPSANGAAYASPGQPLWVIKPTNKPSPQRAAYGQTLSILRLCASARFPPWQKTASPPFPQLRQRQSAKPSPEVQTTFNLKPVIPCLCSARRIPNHHHSLSHSAITCCAGSRMFIVPGKMLNSVKVSDYPLLRQASQRRQKLQPLFSMG